MKKDLKKLKVKTWLPLFNGFYNTLFEFDNESVKESLDYDLSIKLKTKIEIKDKENIIDYYFNDSSLIDKNYRDYEKNVCVEACEIIENELQLLNCIEKLEFEALVQPKYYNYSNDSINIEITLNDTNLIQISNIIEKNLDDLEKNLKKDYTSCDGFCSSYPNNVKEYLCHNWHKDSHKLAYILEFILEKNKYNIESLYYDVKDAVCVDIDTDNLLKEYKGG